MIKPVNQTYTKMGGGTSREITPNMYQVQRAPSGLSDKPKALPDISARLVKVSDANRTVKNWACFLCLVGIWEVKQLGYHPKPLFSL